jgi:hypothetical protein
MMSREFVQIAGAVLAAIALMWAVLWWWSACSSRRKARREQLPLSPWQKLCHVHGISNVDVIRLNALCRATGLADPLLLFVDPRELERAARGDVEPGEYARLGQLLFGATFQPEAQG